MPGPRFPTAALAKLLAWHEVDPKKRSQTRLAEAVGVHPSSCSRWFAGDSRPDPGPQRAAVFLITGIRDDEWLTDEERAASDRTIEEARRRVGDFAAEPAAPAEAS